MRQFSFMERKWGQMAFAILLFALLMLARDTLMTTCLLGFAKSQFLMIGILGVFGLVFLAVNRKHLKDILLDRRMAFMAVSALVLLLPMVLKQDWQLMYFSILVCLLAAVFFTYFANVRDTARIYVVIMAVLCAHSMLGMVVLKALANSGQLTAPVFYNANDWEFYNFGLSYVVTSPAWHRNFGIFREPGVFQFFIILAMYLNNYQADWKRPLVIWPVNAVLAVTMISTFAVGGVIEMGLFVVFLYFDKKWYKTPGGRTLGILAAVGFAAMMVVILIQINKPSVDYTFWFHFKDLYLRLFSGSDSLLDRLDAIFTSARRFLASPLVGDTLADVLHGTNHNTSSTLILFAVLGALGGCLHVASWLALAWETKRGIFGNLVLLTILFMSFNTQNLVADVFFWLFPYMALAERVLPKIPFGKKA